MGEKGEGSPGVILESLREETKLDLTVAIKTGMFHDFCYLTVVVRVSSLPGLLSRSRWSLLGCHWIISVCSVTEAPSLLKAENYLDISNLSFDFCSNY